MFWRSGAGTDATVGWARCDCRMRWSDAMVGAKVVAVGREVGGGRWRSVVVEIVWVLQISVNDLTFMLGRKRQLSEHEREKINRRSPRLLVTPLRSAPHIAVTQPSQHPIL